MALRRPLFKSYSVARTAALKEMNQRNHMYKIIFILLTVLLLFEAIAVFFGAPYDTRSTAVIALVALSVGCALNSEKS